LAYLLFPTSGANFWKFCRYQLIIAKDIHPWNIDILFISRFSILGTCPEATVTYILIFYWNYMNMIPKLGKYILKTSSNLFIILKVDRARSISSKIVRKRFLLKILQKYRKIKYSESNSIFETDLENNFQAKKTNLNIGKEKERKNKILFFLCIAVLPVLTASP